ncbi:hypothetical protein [Phenylobacterium sp.]|jgi:hypothetical protein|uniref:hypothetical protein n=1 Tax=Phenylobacterium sp. TaxID=1871053 RepID=UPI002F406781
MAEATMGGVRAKAAARPQFYFWMACACLAIAVVGFLPTYFVPMAQGRYAAPPIVHLHGMILFSWVAFFVFQSWLAARGKVADHRTWGLVGVSILTAMVFIVVGVVSMRIRQASAPGVPAAITDGVLGFAWVSISAIALVIPAFILAMVYVKRPEVHKRLLLLLTVSLLGAPIARWFLTFSAPPPAPSGPPLPADIAAMAAPPAMVAVAPALVGDILLLIAMGYDWRTRGRPHPVYLIGGAILVLQQLTQPQVADTAAWKAAAIWIGKMAG